ncbi:MAG TPA: DUF6624 domain-containing protein [Bryobacteraceae bacterium]|nr:DUF6624 domain-containing protein [Bryobacteraceae bacterium]
MKNGCGRLAILLLGTVSIWVAQQASDFGGTWVMKFKGQAILKLTLATGNGTITGWMTKPRQLTIDQDGDVTNIGPDQVTVPIRNAVWNGGKLELTIEDDRFVLTMEDHSRALLALQGMRPWHLERAPGDHVILASRLPEPDYPQEIRTLRDQLRAMVEEDQAARLAFDHARMNAADAKNRSEVLRIFDRYGWVTDSLAGKDAAHNFWLLVQHQTPEIQQRLLPALEKAARDGNASMTDYAYLYDRVQMGLGKPQHWGTQAKCENGKPVLYPVDDPEGLDTRRKALYMLPVREYLQLDYLIKSCAPAGK